MSVPDAPTSGPVPRASARPHTRWGFTVLFGLIGALIVGIVVIAFAWPAATARARDLPVGISGPSSQVSALRTSLEKLDPDPFWLERVDARADAVAGIRDRTLYGAILLGDSPEVLTSSAASTASNQALRGVAAQLQARISSSAIQGLTARLQQLVAASSGGASSGVSGGSSGGSSGAPSSGSSSSAGSSGVPTVKITDVVALSDDDPNGAGITAAAFPIALGGMLGGVLISLLVVGVVRRLGALVIYGVAGGAAVVLVLQTVLHALQGEWWLNAAAIGLAMLATAAVVTGFAALIGPRGIAVGAVITILVGNPISGATLPPSFIAAPWGTVGQYFVPGSAATLVRSLSYFPDADTAPQWWTLAAWAAGGVLLSIAGHFRSRAAVPLPAVELEHEHESGRHVAA